VGRRTTLEPDWDAEARDFALEFEELLDEGRDRLILHFLELGDPRPLIHFLKNGHEFGQHVRNYLAWMLDDKKPYPPFQLVVDRRRNRSRRKKPFSATADNEWRDGQAALRVNTLAHKVGRQEAIEQVAREMGIGFDTVRKAYDRICGKKQR
jgi:hypothetical protein